MKNEVALESSKGRALAILVATAYVPTIVLCGLALLLLERWEMAEHNVRAMADRLAENRVECRHEKDKLEASYVIEMTKYEVCDEQYRSLGVAAKACADRLEQCVEAK